MRKRVEIFERVINLAKRDKEGPKNWKETHGGISQEERELKEEKKVEEVFIHTKWSSWSHSIYKLNKQLNK